MTESCTTCSQSRVEQVNEIIASVTKCEQKMNEVMERLQWSRDKLPKAKNPTKHVEATEAERIGAVARQSSQSMGHQERSESGIDFPEFGDRSKLHLTSYTDLNKLKRDMRRRRVKHRVTKTAPLTYTEEIRELIAIQMEIERNRLK